MSERENLNETDRRELRRRRRIRNTVIAYAALVLILITASVGIYFGGKMLIDQFKAAPSPAPESVEEEAEEPIVEADIEPLEQPVAEIQEEDLLGELINTNISQMTLEERVAGLFIVTPEQLTGVKTAVKAGDGTKTALEQYAVGGLIYFSQNIQSEEQLEEMLRNTVSYSKYPLFLSVDEEGGTVSRVGNSKLGVEKVEDAAAIGASGDTSKAYEAGQTIGTYLLNYGFNLNFAPVADVLTNSDNVIGKRSYSSDGRTAAEMVFSAVEGLESTGISACAKHFPGQGDTAEDAHDGAAAINKTLEEMRQTEFLPFISAIEADVDFIMVGHVSVPSIIGDATPSSLSSVMVTDILRNDLGFEGIIVTDALNMGAIKKYYSPEEAAVKAIQAGADMLLMPEDFVKAYEGVLAAVNAGTISEERINESLRRIYRVKYQDALK